MRLLERLAAEGGKTPPASAGTAAAGGLLEDLTAREAEVLELLARGFTNPQIAKALLHSISTVKVCVKSITEKLGVSDRTQAAVRAIELGLVSSGIED